MNRWSLVVEFVFVALLVAAPLPAQPASGRGGMGMMGSGESGLGSRGWGAQPVVGLSPATRIAIIKQQIDFVRSTSQLRTDLAVRQLELEQLLLAEKPDSIAIDAKYAEIGKIQGDLQQAAVLSNTAIAQLVPNNERARFSLGVMDYAMRYGYGPDFGLGLGIAGYGAGYGVPRGYCPYCTMMGSIPGNGGFSWW
jgi:hypothetical protein